MIKMRPAKKISLKLKYKTKVFLQNKRKKKIEKETIPENLKKN